MRHTLKKRLPHIPLKEATTLLFHNSRILLFSQSLFFLFLYLTLIPILTFGFERTLKVSGISYVTLGNLSTYLTNPMTLLFGLVIFGVFSLMVIIEDQLFKTYFSIKQHHMTLKLFDYFQLTLHNIIKTLKEHNPYTLLSTWSRILSFNFPLLFFITRESPFLEFIKNETSRFLVWSLVIIGYGILVYITHQKTRHMLKKFLYWNMLQGFIYMVIYTVLMLITILIITFTLERHLAVPALISVSTRIHQYYIVFLMFASTSSHYALYTVINEQALNLDDIDLTVKHPVTYKQLLSTNNRRLIVLIIFLILSVDIFYALNILKNGSALKMNTLDQIQITSHRGYSYNYPENTLPAIEIAIESFADYVEIDVRVTKDGEFVLLHDQTLKRTTGLRKAIWDVTYEEIKDLDAGSWKDKRFSDVKIPTLIEVFENTKGRVYLNLDLKFTKTQTDAVTRLVELIDTYDMQYQLMVTSTCLECLEAIKNLNPNIQTGYITYRITPALLSNSNIDVFSMKSSLVTKSVVEKSHAYGKKVLVWTVNTRREIERLSRLGVDNLITDRPSYAKDVLYKSTGDQYLIALLKVILD